jgi:hypoxanthine phosphoribosyltransferase
MSNITLFNKTFEPYLPESLIQEKIKELGEVISKQY